MSELKGGTAVCWRGPRVELAIALTDGSYSLPSTRRFGVTRCRLINARGPIATTAELRERYQGVHIATTGEGWADLVKRLITVLCALTSYGCLADLKPKHGTWRISIAIGTDCGVGE